MLPFIQQPHRNQPTTTRPSHYKDWSDVRLINKILDGETELFRLLVDRHNERLFRIIRSYVSDTETAKDALQQTYLNAYQHLDSWNGNAKFTTWITRIAINEALKQINRRKRYSDLHSFQLNQGESEWAAKSEDTPEDETIQQDLKRVLKQAVQTLSSTYRSVYIKREMEEMSTTRTAENLGISTANVKVRLHRARKKLRKTLRRQLAEPVVLH